MPAPKAYTPQIKPHIMQVSRESAIYLARLSDTAERHADMVNYVRIMASFPGPLTFEERTLLSVAFKNLTGELRYGWRKLSVIRGSIMHHKEARIHLVAREQARIQAEIVALCAEMLEIIDKLLPHAQSDEFKVFYLKTRADYGRYLSDAAADEEQRISAAQLSLAAYTEAHLLAVRTLPATHVTRLGLALNHSVFFYDVRKSPEHACHVAKSAFDDAVAELDDLEEENYRDSVMILQLMRDNMVMWVAEFEDEDDNEVVKVHPAEASR